MVTYLDLVHQYIIRGFDKQMWLADLLEEKGNPNWESDNSMAKLSFGNAYHFDMQLVGSESTRSDTWMWSWANTMSNLPPAVVHSSQQMRTYGQQHNIPELTTRLLPLDEYRNGFMFSFIGVGLVKADACYRGPYAGGALFMLIQDKQYPQLTTHPVQRITTILPQFISGLVLPDLPTAVFHYLQSYDLRIERENTRMIGIHADGSQVTVTFDEQKRIANIEVTVQPRGKSAGLH